MTAIFTRVLKPMNNWPVSHLSGSTTGVSQLLSAPGRNQSHYLTGFLLSGGLTAEGFNILRRSCVELDAAGEKITIPGNAALEPADGDFSIEFWCKITNGQKTIANMIHKDDGLDQGYFAELTSTGVLKFTMGDGTHVATITGNTVINDGKWHHIVVTCDISEGDGLNLYLDGVADATAVDPTGVSGCTGGATDFTINGAADKEWWISTYGLYKALALSAATVLDRYNAGVGYKYTGSEAGLSVAINIDEGVGTVCYDKVAANNGAITNATWKSDGIPIDGDTLPVIDKILCGLETQVDTTGSYVIGNAMVEFPHAIKIGRNNPLAILEASGSTGSFTLILFGFTDIY